MEVFHIPFPVVDISLIVLGEVICKMEFLCNAHTYIGNRRAFMFKGDTPEKVTCGKKLKFYRVTDKFTLK